MLSEREKKGFSSLEAYLKKWIEKSDAIVLLIGARYGSKGDDGISWTEKEFQLAINLKKPVFCYIREHPEVDWAIIDFPVEVQNFIRLVENRLRIIPHYSFGQCCKLAAMVMRDLIQWERTQSENEGEEMSLSKLLGVDPSTLFGVIVTWHVRREDHSTLADYTLPVAPVPIRGLFSRPTTRTAGRQSGAMGNPRLAARISWTVTEVATRT